MALLWGNDSLLTDVVDSVCGVTASEKACVKAALQYITLTTCGQWRSLKAKKPQVLTAVWASMLDDQLLSGTVLRCSFNGMRTTLNI